MKAPGFIRSLLREPAGCPQCGERRPDAAAASSVRTCGTFSRPELGFEGMRVLTPVSSDAASRMGFPGKGRGTQSTCTP